MAGRIFTSSKTCCRYSSCYFGNTDFKHDMHLLQKDSSLNWILLKSSEFSGVYPFRPPRPLALSQHYVGSVYRFAISVERRVLPNNFTVSSGLLWSDCVYNANKSKSVFMPATHISTVIIHMMTSSEMLPEVVTLRLGKRWSVNVRFTTGEMYFQLLLPVLIFWL